MNEPHVNWAEGLPFRIGPWLFGLSEPSPETAEYWRGVERGELLLKRCAGCQRFLHPRRIVCPDCSGADLVWERACGRATVYSFSEIFRAPHPSLKGAVPYVVGIVRLEEGVHLFTRIVREGTADVAIGSPVQVDFRRLETGFLLPVFLTTS